MPRSSKAKKQKSKAAGKLSYGGVLIFISFKLIKTISIIIIIILMINYLLFIVVYNLFLSFICITKE